METAAGRHLQERYGDADYVRIDLATSMASRDTWSMLGAEPPPPRKKMRFRCDGPRSDAADW
jgi:hypothetical protein